MENNAHFLPGLILVLGLSAGCRMSGSDAAKALVGNGNLAPELSMENLKVQSIGPRGIEWELTSPKGEGFTEKNMMSVAAIRIQMYENAQKSSEITADVGYMATGPVNPAVLGQIHLPVTLSEFKDGDILFSGQVVVVSTDGQKLATDWLHYRRDADLIVSSAPVRVERQDSVTTGTGMEATPDLTNLKIFKQNVLIKGKKAI